MKKTIIFAAIAAAVLAGCTKEQVATSVDSQDGEYIVMNAGFADPDTKLAFEADGTGYKTTWTTVDTVRLFYNNNSGSKGALFTGEGDVVPGSDATTAQIKFNVTGISGLSGDVKWGAYATSGHVGAKPAYGYWTDNYGTQDGTEASAQKFIFYYAGGTNLLSDLANPVTFSCKNTMLKFTLTFPSSVTTGKASDITISGTNIYTTANYSWGAFANGTKGSITIADQTITDGKITFWATVAPATVSNVVVSAKVGEVTYRASVGDKELAAGKVYNIARTLADNIISTYWANDATGSKAFSGTAADDAKTSKHSVMTYSNSTGKISWTANETGKPRTDTLEFTNGDVFILNQLEAKDFVGDYTFYNYSFFANSNTTLVDNANRKHETAVTISLHSSSEQLSGKTYNLELKGLYNEFVMPVSFELTDNGPSFYTYLSDESQNVTNNITTTSDSLKVLSKIDVAIVPEESKTAAWTTKDFAPKTFGTDNKYWGKWNFEDLFTEPKIVMGKGEDRMIETGCYFAGFSVVLKDYAQIPYNPSKTRAYVTIYQMNYNNKWEYSTAGGAYFKKK